MSRKDFDKYFQQVCNQFFSLNEVFDELSNELSKGMVEPERVEQLKLTIEPVKQSYQTLSYIKYLLDKPNRKSKQARYDKSCKKVLDETKGNHSEDVISRNDSVIRGLRK